MLCCCERDEQTASRIMSDYNIDLGEWGVSSVPALMAKIVDYFSSSIHIEHSLGHCNCQTLNCLKKDLCMV